MSIDSRQLTKWPKIIMKKFMKAQESDQFQITQAVEDNLNLFYILIKPTGGHYKNQAHILEFKTRDGSNTVVFPFTRPTVRFITQIYHPNVSGSGGICVDILTHADKWSPQYGFEAVMSSILLLMDVPNPSSPYNGEAARLYVDCDKKYKDQSGGVKDSKELDAIYIEAFKPYDEQTRKHATSDISKFLPLFNKTSDIENSTIFDDMKEMKI
jgi:ubiquitin-protein ligase